MGARLQQVGAGVAMGYDDAKRIMRQIEERLLVSLGLLLIDLKELY